MSTYRERRGARAERLRTWADRREAKAVAADAKVRQIADMIPMGQPILAGHHSQGRHMRDLGRIDSGMRAYVEHSDKAAAMRSKADNIDAAAEQAIYRDDLDAAERLAEKLAGLEAERSRVKAYNATCRKGAPDRSLLDERQIADLDSCIQVWGEFQCKGGAFPSYHLSNLSGRISTTRKRLAELE